MPAQIVASSRAAEILGGSGYKSYTLNSVGEASCIALDRRSAGEQVAVLAYRRATAQFAATQLEAAGLRVALVLGGTAPGDRARLHAAFDAGDADVMVTTSVEGWRAPARCRTLVHVELPPYGPQFEALMDQREARLPMGGERHIPEMNRFVVDTGAVVPVLALHARQYPSVSDEVWDRNAVCSEDGKPWPCDTVRLFGGPHKP